MADTVKKSRIVSDEEDNLEEALLEEFNIRLKNCMSQDDLQKDPEPEPPEPSSDDVYENVPAIVPSKRHIVETETFLRNETCPPENYYDEPRKLTTNGHDEQIYECILEKTDDHLDQNYVPMLDIKKTKKDEDDAKQTEDYEPMGLEDGTASNLYESVELKRSSGGPALDLPVTSFTDYSEDRSPDRDAKCTTAKDRMLLSCDDTSTLLFTQTVTSPMLTPSEENIDFLKGFQRENTNSESTTTPPKDLEKLEATETSPDVSEPLEEEKASENFYENTQFHKNTTPENTYENLVVETVEEAAPAVPREEENIYERLEMRQGEEAASETNVYENIEEALERAGYKSQDTDEGSLEEFIRNEKEVSEGLHAEEKVPEDVVDRVHNTNGPSDLDRQEKIKTFNGTTTEKVTTIATTTTTVADNENKESYKELIYHHKSESNSNYYEKYTEVVSKSSKIDVLSNREKDTETVPAEIVKNLKNQFQSKADVDEGKKAGKKDTSNEAKGVKMIDQIKNKFEIAADGDEAKDVENSTEYSETIVQTTAPGEISVKKKKVKKTRKEEKENISVKSSFSKFDALQKKNVLHVRSSDSTKAQEKFSNGTQIELSTNCKACGKQVFQMEQIKAEKALWHKNCFRCIECSKQLTVDTYESNDGTLYCKPHFKALFAPKAVEEEPSPSDKPDLGLEELQSLNVKERFQVFEHYQSQQTETSELDRGVTNVKRSPSILSKLAKFQKHGMDVGVSNEALDGIPIEESESEEEEEEEVPEGEDPDLIRAKRVQKEKPFHFTGMSDVKKRWEQGDHAKEERREETKQEIQNIRTRLFMGKQEKMKEAYQQAVMESESSSNLRKSLGEQIEACDTKSIKERFERGEVANERINKENRNVEEEEVYESEISKKSRSLFLELDANSSKPPQMSPVTPPKLEVKKAREAYLEKTAREDTVKSTQQVEDVEVHTAEIQERFKFFETYKEPEKERKEFRMTPPRDPSQVKTETPEREIYRDPDVVRAEEYVDDSHIAKETHTASKMLNKFRQMEESLNREPEIQGPKPLKRFTPPPEPARVESRSEEEESSEYEEEEEETNQNGKLPQDLIEAQKAARAKQLRAKFEKWEAKEIKKEQQNSVNIVEEYGEEQSQIESTRVLRAKFEQMRDSTNESSKVSRVKPNRFVEISATTTEICQSCNDKVYPLEKISIHGNVYHKACFKCMECSCVLRMDSYSYNQGLLYCTPHFKRLFISKGNYDSAFGLDQHKEKWQNSVNNMTVA